tara:strand:+ start:1018 stop:1353 length:336 start_codon:yes stop_codon:yes gene_type:complete
MNKKIIINKRQIGVITKFINENIANVRLKNKIQTFLENDYEPSFGVKKIANEFYDQALIKKKIDGEEITPIALSKYLVHKFNGLTKKEINDSIKGWYYGDYNKETGMRSKK